MEISKGKIEGIIGGGFVEESKHLYQQMKYEYTMLSL